MVQKGLGGGKTMVVQLIYAAITWDWEFMAYIYIYLISCIRHLKAIVQKRDKIVLSFQLVEILMSQRFAPGLFRTMLEVSFRFNHIGV